MFVTVDCEGLEYFWLECEIVEIKQTGWQIWQTGQQSLMPTLSSNQKAVFTENLKSRYEVG